MPLNLLISIWIWSLHIEMETRLQSLVCNKHVFSPFLVMETCVWVTQSHYFWWNMQLPRLKTDKRLCCKLLLRVEILDLDFESTKREGLLQRKFFQNSQEAGAEGWMLDTVCKASWNNDVLHLSHAADRFLAASLSSSVCRSAPLETSKSVPLTAPTTNGSYSTTTFRFLGFPCLSQRSI